MTELYKKVKDNPLFFGISEEDISKMLNCFTCRERKYSAGEMIFAQGDTVTSTGLILDGCVHLVREDYNGNRTIISKIDAGDIFAESLAFAPESEKISPSGIYAASDCSVLFLDCKKILSVCKNSCRCHIRFTENMLSVISRKNLNLNRRLSHLSRRSTKEKLLSYLHEQASICGKNSFYIPFDRQQLADYLCVERSAMSAVLSELKKSRQIDFNKNFFVISTTACSD